MQLSFVGIRKAYFNGVPKRKLFLFLPKEMGQPPKAVARLKKCVYGTRDAGLIWEECYSHALTSLGFKRGVSCPTAFFHPDRRIHIVVHGDDFTAMGRAEDLTWYETEVKKHFEIGDCQRMGQGKGACSRCAS